MQTYKECSDEQYEKALKIAHEEDLSSVPDELLYIAFTKYAADYMNLARVAVSVYHHSLLHRIKQKRDRLASELDKRKLKYVL